MQVALALLYNGFGLWLYAKHRAVFTVLFFFLFAFWLRLHSAIALDVLGPMDSSQLGKAIGGGHISYLLFLVYVLTLTPLVAMLMRMARNAPFDTPSPPYHASYLHRVRNTALSLSVLSVVILYLDFGRIGVVPLFAGMERYDYTRFYGGFLHQRLMEWGSVIAFTLGYFYASGRQRMGKYDSPFLGLFASILVYLLLAGHRFSGFYSYASFFMIPVGAINLLRRAPGAEVRPAAKGRLLPWHKYILVATIPIVAYGTYNSFVYVRAFSDIEGFLKFQERVVVQPAELWEITHDRIFEKAGAIDMAAAWHYIFVDPLDGTRNTTIQYLMHKALPNVADNILTENTQFAGGYPEVLFELGGLLPGLIGAGLMSAIFAGYLSLIVKAVMRGWPLTVLALGYVYYTGSLFYISGMINFILQWTLLVKLLVIGVCYAMESGAFPPRANFGLRPSRGGYSRRRQGTPTLPLPRAT